MNTCFRANQVKLALKNISGGSGVLAKAGKTSVDFSPSHLKSVGASQIRAGIKGIVSTLSSIRCISFPVLLYIKREKSGYY